MLSKTLRRNKAKTTGRRGHQFSSNSSISYQPRYEYTSAGGSLAGPLSVNGDTKIPQLIVRYDSGSDCNEDYDESSSSDFLKDRFRRPGLEADKNFSDSAHYNFNHSDWRGIKSRGFNSLGRYPLKQLHARQIRQERSQLNLQNDADESDFRIYPSNLKTSFSKHLSDPESIYQSLLRMGHTSSKRSRQDHTQHIPPIHRSVNAQPRFVTAIKVHKLQFGIDKRLTIIDEKSNAVLKYRTPHFRFINSEVVVMVITMMLMMMMLIMMLLMVLALVFLLF